MSNETGTRGHRHSHNKSNLRCDECSKLSRDYIDGKNLCRVHSPMRLGYNKLKENKK